MVRRLQFMTGIAAILWILAQLPAQTQEAEKVLRYVSQRTDKAYMREGPTYAHRVLWVYRHRGYPFAVLAEFDVWRRVRAPDGAIGWMSASMLSDNRTVLVMGKGRAKISEKPDGGKIVALADPGAVANLEACVPSACHIHGEDIDGWIPRGRIWGIGANEVFDKLPR
jgi:SH3-like domain-containing protein